MSIFDPAIWAQVEAKADPRTTTFLALLRKMHVDVGTVGEHLQQHADILTLMEQHAASIEDKRTEVGARRVRDQLELGIDSGSKLQHSLEETFAYALELYGVVR